MLDLTAIQIQQMVLPMHKLLNYRASIIATVFIAILSSIASISTYEFIIKSDVSGGTQLANSSASTISSTVLDCEVGVYSPVQNKCVSMEVFDREMRRLFSAIGIDASPYQTSQ